MDHFQAIKNNYLTIHDHFLPIMLSAEGNLLRNRVIKEINPIMWIAWHILRTEDMYLSTVVYDETQAFHEGRWMDKLNISTANTGTGMSATEADEIARSIDRDQLLEYNQIIKERSLVYVDRSVELPDDVFAKEEDLDRCLQEAEVFPDGVRQERANAYAKFPLSVGITGIVMHGFMHVGQYLSVTKPL